MGRANTKGSGRDGFFFFDPHCAVRRHRPDTLHDNLTTEKKELMKRNLVLLMLPAAFLAQSAAADPAWVNKPLTISTTFQEQTGPNARCAGPAGTITATGTASELGPIALIGTHCIEPRQQSFLFTQGKAFVTTRNGDRLEATYSGTLIPTGDGPNFVFGSGTFQIVGGTGCFKHASGGGSIQGKENIQTGQGAAQYDGTLSYRSPKSCQGGQGQDD